MENNNGWNEYKQFVVQELKRSNNRLKGIEDRLMGIEKELAVLKTKMYIGSALVDGRRNEDII